MAIGAIALMVLCAVSCKGPKSKEESNDANQMVLMHTSEGTMKIMLYNETPQHRDNFLKLASEGFYNGIKFHRVIEGFMIQGGDPLTKDDAMIAQWGTGGPGYTVAAEFNPELHHKKGALAAARQGDMVNPRKASSGSQFYIVQSETGCQHLDGEYTIYGEVVEGLDVIDRIAGVETDRYDHPVVPIVIDSVVIVKVDEAAEDVVEEPADSTKAE